MALYERRIGEQLHRAFTQDGSDEDLRYAGLVAAGIDGWEKTEPGTANEATGTGPFDPATHDIPQVLTYLEGAGHDEALRVLDAEAAEHGKQRKGILSAREEILAREQAADEELAAKQKEEE
jgi:hypothetical protein